MNTASPASAVNLLAAQMSEQQKQDGGENSQGRWKRAKSQAQKDVWKSNYDDERSRRLLMKEAGEQCGRCCDDSNGGKTEAFHSASITALDFVRSVTRDPLDSKLRTRV